MRLTARLNSQVDHAIFENIALLQSMVIFKLLARENKALLVSGDTFHLLYTRLDGGSGVRVRDLQGDDFPCQQLDEYLHVAQTRQGQAILGGPRILENKEISLLIAESRPVPNARVWRRTLPYSAAECWVVLADKAAPSCVIPPDRRQRGVAEWRHAAAAAAAPYRDQLTSSQLHIGIMRYW